MRADDSLQNGRYRRALEEARAVQSEDPLNEQAKIIAEEAELQILIEECIKNAREALDAGDRETALTEIRKGGDLAPNDRRLRELFKEAMKQ